jgi:hypothetical protein
MTADLTGNTKERRTLATAISKELGRASRKAKRLARHLLCYPACHSRRLLHRSRATGALWQERSNGKFVLYRILGNDLVPRHEQRQTLRNLEFILAHEPPLERCEKRWILNRIHDEASEKELMRLIEAAGHTYVRIPFDPAIYRTIGLDVARFGHGFFDSPAFSELDPIVQSRARVSALRLKNLYAINNNGARNAALQEGGGAADWVLPWDGNCFLTSGAWRSIIDSVDRSRILDYHVVPMARILDNADLLHENADIVARDEPQLIFHRNAREMFNPEIPYGRRPKIELLSRLGVRGPWDRWAADPWDLKPSGFSPDRYLFNGKAGWVARLSSGYPNLEQGHKADANRAHARNQAIIRTLAMLDERFGDPRGDRVA